MTYIWFLLLEMSYGCFVTLASIEAVRPVFSIVMGIFLLVIAWRLSRSTSGWTSRFIVSGAFLLAFGYILLLPMYEAGTLQNFSPRHRNHPDAASILAWHLVKLTVMNAGWLFLGLGIAMHAKVFSSPTPASKSAPVLAPHDTVVA